MLKVKIKNFQSISDTSFEVDGFTVIVGKNNKGKSAIVRAIDAALSNRLGNNFIKWGKLETQIKLEKDDLDITWTKGETTSYEIKRGEEKKKPYTSLKGAVPSPILEAGFRKMQIADEKLNPLVAHQFEELFLINRSGPFVTETLSTLYDLNVINDADSLCQKKLKAAKGLLKTRQTDAEAVAESIENFKGLDEVKIQFESIKQLQAKADKLQAEINEVEVLSNQLKSQLVLVNKLKEVKKLKLPETKNASEKVIEFQWIVQTVLQYERLNSLVQNLKGLTGIKIPDTTTTKNLIQEVQTISTFTLQYERLNSLVQNLKGLTGIKIPNITKASELIQEVQTISTITGELKTLLLSCEKCKSIMTDLKDLPTITSKLKFVETQVQTYTQLNQLTDDFITLATEVKEVKSQFQQAKTNLESAQKELDEFKVCPLCKKPLTPVHTHE